MTRPSHRSLIPAHSRCQACLPCLRLWLARVPVQTHAPRSLAARPTPTRSSNPPTTHEEPAGSCRMWQTPASSSTGTAVAFAREALEGRAAFVESRCVASVTVSNLRRASVTTLSGHALPAAWPGLGRALPPSCATAPPCQRRRHHRHRRPHRHCHFLPPVASAAMMPRPRATSASGLDALPLHPPPAFATPPTCARSATRKRASALGRQLKCRGRAPTH
mmetsp:Transcript_12654/g.25481  ORF Transcript_12654/g.25481 Transcript_12654/m.25481 type:complete len:220 (+) Transcript_12654:111-770(+)